MSPVMLLLLVIGILLSGCGAVEHVLTWTADGVRNYTMQPLEVMLGDVLTLNCHPTNISNFVYVESREQYDSCNASATRGKVLRSGDCLGTFSDAKSFSQNIQRLSGPGQAVVDYQVGNYYYFYSSADGRLGSGEPPYVGGQCLEGLKMIMFIESFPSPSSASHQPAYTLTISPGPLLHLLTLTTGAYKWQ